MFRAFLVLITFLLAVGCSNLPPVGPLETVSDIREDGEQPPEVGPRCPLMWTCDDGLYYPTQAKCGASACGNKASCFREFKCGPGCYCP